jgi:alanine racemase
MMASDLPIGATGVITINLAQIAENWRALARLVAPAQCGAVVKANAYGLGANHVIPVLYAAGCRAMFIATPAEALEARTLAPDAELYVLDGLFPGTAPMLHGVRAMPALASLDEVREWCAFARILGHPLPGALNLATGLNRLGLCARDVDILVSDTNTLRWLDLKLVMSHLASADDPADPKNEAQRDAFEHLRTRLPPSCTSLAASDGLMLGPRFHYDLVRPGYALYGGQAFRGGPAPVKPALRVAAHILQLRDVPAGETVGYSGTWTAPRPARIAVVAAGYADGIARSLSSIEGGDAAKVRVHGTLAPIVGRVSMDLITVDVTDVEAFVARGDLVELIGPDLTIETMGARAGTIGYEVLTRLGSRFHRLYLD